ncbi:unnamed protein product [Orchesella dallaii]|uniref:Uncharacterized protein n=1 Tax=Orchesella dallaii TaxID=48710 RepID=A0ABP1PTH1_9HEXA
MFFTNTTSFRICPSGKSFWDHGGRNRVKLLLWDIVIKSHTMWHQTFGLISFGLILVLSDASSLERKVLWRKSHEAVHSGVEDLQIDIQLMSPYADVDLIHPAGTQEGNGKICQETYDNKFIPMLKAKCFLRKAKRFNTPAQAIRLSPIPQSLVMESLRSAL